MPRQILETMGLKAFLLDDENTPHLLIGLNQQDVESIQRGEVFRLPSGENVPLTEKSDIVLIFEPTDEDLVERMKAGAVRGQTGKHRSRHRSQRRERLNYS